MTTANPFSRGTSLFVLCSIVLITACYASVAPTNVKQAQKKKSLDKETVLLSTSTRAGARDTIGRIAQRAKTLGYAGHLVTAIYTTVNHLAYVMQTNQPVDEIIAALRAYSTRAGNLAHWLILNGFVQTNAQDSRDSQTMYYSFSNTAAQAFNLESTAFGFSSDDRNQWLNWARQFLGHDYNYFPVHDELRRRRS